MAWNIINAAAKHAGIKECIGCHSLRKTFGYHATKNGVGIAVLQKVFNHSHPAVTERYIGLMQDDIAEVYQGLAC
ncbi:integrase [Fischerella thermalis CCMEE 5273]|nr:integrase [Fischerella thermalis CCMEE 5273]